MSGLWKINNPCSLSLAQQVSFCASFGRRWNNDFSLFLPVFQDSSFIYRLLVPLNQSLSLSHTCTCTRACSHTHTHTHTHTLIISQCPFLSDHSLSWPENLPLWGIHLHSRTRILHLLPPRNHLEFHSFTQTLSPVTGERYLEQSQVSWENELSTEKLKKVMLMGRGINQEILRSLWSLWLH